MRAPERIGRYRVQALLGVGGFAAVYRAHDEALDDAVAIKILADHWLADGDMRERFLAEARLMRRIRTDHLVTVHDIGELDGGQPYFVMEFAKRGCLADRFTAGTRNGIDPTSARSIASGLAAGLGALHRAGIVHRDVNPRNLFLQAHDASGPEQPRAAQVTMVRHGLIGADERLLLGDLGLAKDVVRTGGTASVVGGTPRYAAPEQLDPQAPVEPAADVFAATGVLWEAITGSPPPPPRELHHALVAVDTAWHAFFTRGLADDPDDRFEDMASWLEAVPIDRTSGASSTRPTLASSATQAATCPYKGLAPFQPEDTGRFFGRDVLVGELLERLSRQRTLMVGGPSGSGKSSLVRAGLIPAVNAGGLRGSERWPVLLCTPRSDPIGELTYQLTKSAGTVTQQAPGGAAGAPIRDPLHARYLAESMTDLTGGLLLVVDQFEELFTQCGSRDEQEAYLELLAGLVDPADSRVRLVLAMRADFYGASALFPWLARRITENQVLVGPMARNELRQSIEEPARQAGLRLEDGLVDAILEEGGVEPGSLPLVSHALAETWRRRKGTTLTITGYQQAGGVAGALAQTAEEVYQRLDERQRGAARRLLLRMITPGEGAADTRRSLRLSALKEDDDAEVVTAVAEELTGARLLTIDRETVEIAHETLLASWPRLREWIEQSREDLRVRQRIDRAGAEWAANGREPDLLYRGTPLQSALEWADEHGAALSPIGRELLQASRAAWAEEEQRRAAAARRSRRRRRAAVAVLGTLTVLAVGASIVAFTAWGQANARLAQSLATQAVALAEEDPRLAAALAVEAMARGGAPSLEARAALVEAGRAQQAIPFAPAGAPVSVGDALSAAVRPDGGVFATGGRDGTVRLWDMATGEALGPALEGHGGAVQDVRFTPDGRWLVSASDDATIRRWDVADPSAVPASAVLGTTGGVVWSLGITPDGATVASASVDGTVRLWDLEALAQRGDPLLEDTHSIDQMTVSPDGTLLLAGNSLGQVRGWSLPEGELVLGPLDLHDSPVWSVDVHPSGELVASVGSDGNVALWDPTTEEVLAEPFADSSDGIHVVRFAADGDLLLGGDVEGRLRLWDTALGEERGVAAAAHGGRMLRASVSSDGNALVTLATDHTLRRWTTAPALATTVLTGHTDGAFGLALDPGGTVVATGDGAGGVHLHDLDTGEQILALDGHEAAVWALAFSPDGTRVASGDADGVVLVHDARSGTVLARIPGSGQGVPVVRFSGDRLLTGGADGVVRIWNTDGVEVGQAMGGHRGGVTDMTAGPDGTLAVADRQGDVRLWRVDDGAAVGASLPADANTVWSLAWSETNRVLATASADEVVTLWDLAREEVLARLTPHRGGATGVAFLADGVTVVSSDRDGTVRLWDVSLGRAIGGALEGHEGAVWRVVPHPEDGRFVTSSEDGTVRVWDVLDVERACERARGAFDEEQRRRYLGEGESAAGCR